MPTSCPLLLTTGNPLILFCNISCTARVTDWSGSTVIAPHVMTSRAFMVHLLRVVGWRCAEQASMRPRRNSATKTKRRGRRHLHGSGARTVARLLAIASNTFYGRDASGYCVLDYGRYPKVQYRGSLLAPVQRLIGAKRRNGRHSARRLGKAIIIARVPGEMTILAGVVFAGEWG